MANKTYFNYGDPIKSKTLVEAISLPYGVGPICGFGSADIDTNNNKIKIYPYGIGDDGGAQSQNFVDPTNFMIRSKLRNHTMDTSDDDSTAVDYLIKFALIAKDGILYRSGDANIEVSIEGTRSTYTQVLLFAEHVHVSEPVENRVTFRAFWNESANDFYTLYKKSLDVYYSNQNKKAIASTEDGYDPYLNKELSYDSLMNWVSGACSEYNTNQKKMVLIGIYGIGNNISENNQSENFALVPYGGNFPVNLPYNFAVHNYLKSVLSRAESLLDYANVTTVIDPDTNQPFDSIVDYVNYLINTKVKSLEKLIEESILPPGSIILYDGETIPEGWEEYTAAAGRIVIGYRSGGINVDGYDKTILSMVGSVYDPNPSDGTWTIRLSKDKLPQHIHATGYDRVEYKSQADPRGDDPIITDFDKRDKSITSNDGVTRKLTSGAALTSKNLLSDTPTNEQTLAITYLDKLVPAITLRYIKKKTSKG